MTAQQRDERMNLLAIVVTLIALPIVVGILTSSVLAVLVTYVLTQGFVIGTVLMLAAVGKVEQS